MKEDITKEYIRTLVLSKWTKERLADGWCETYIKYKELRERIDKALEYIETKWKKDSYYEDIENCLQFCNFSEFDKEDLLDILRGEE